MAKKKKHPLLLLLLLLLLPQMPHRPLQQLPPPQLLLTLRPLPPLLLLTLPQPLQRPPLPSKSPKKRSSDLSDGRCSSMISPRKGGEAAKTTSRYPKKAAEKRLFCILRQTPTGLDFSLEVLCQQFQNALGGGR